MRDSSLPAEDQPGATWPGPDDDAAGGRFGAQSELPTRTDPRWAQDVVIVSWPEEAFSLKRLRDKGRPRLLLVSAGANPPMILECIEDWVRLPAADADVRARLAGLRNRAARHGAVPRLTGDGRLTFRGRWVNVSGAEEALARVLLEAPDGLAADDDVLAAANSRRPTTANAFHVNLSRLRKRLAPLSLVIRRVRGRGYVLESIWSPGVPDPPGDGGGIGDWGPPTGS